MTQDIISFTMVKDNLERLHERSERRRLDGVKPTKAQINRALKCRTLGTRQHSKRVLREITREMLPKTSDINYFLGVK